MRKSLLFALLITLFAVSAQATSLEVGFSDERAQFALTVPIVEDNYGTAKFYGRFLYNDDEPTTLGSGGFEFSGTPGNVPGLELGVGAQLFVGATHHDQDILAAGIGIRPSYAPPALGGLGFSAKLYYAPKIFSTLDVERLVEAGGRVFYAITPKIRIFAEYQNIRADFDGPRNGWTIDEGLMGGFSARF
jgi:hypothetical protein